MPSLNLAGPEYEEVVNAILDAYDISALEQMLLFKLDKKLGLFLNTTKPMLMIVFELLKHSEAEGWTSELLTAAHNYVPGNQKLADVYRKLVRVPEQQQAQPEIEIVEPPKPPYLSQQQVLELDELLVRLGFADKLNMLVGGMDLQYRAQLIPTSAGDPSSRLLQVLFKLNEQGPLIGGEIPFATLLMNAVHQSKVFPESKRIQEMLNLVQPTETLP